MPTRVESRNRALAHPAAFVLFVFAWTWAFWLTAIFNGLGTTTPAGLALALVGLLGPTLGGIGFTMLTRDRAGRRDYWVRLIDPRRIPPRWYLAIFLMVPALMGLTALIDLALGGDAESYAARFNDFFADPGAIPVMLLLVLLIGPLPEEFGWHGYLLDRLQERAGPVAAGIQLGFIWAAWHVPLFFLAGTYQAEQGAFGIWFWTFMIAIVPLEVVLAWVYNNTHRSTFGMIVLHFVVVVSCNFLNATPGANVISTLLWFALAAAVVVMQRREPIAAAPHAA